MWTIQKDYDGSIVHSIAVLKKYFLECFDFNQ